MTPRILAAHWLVPAKPRRIILHWTAGTYRVSPLEQDHYHFMIEAINGQVLLQRGRHSIADNDRTGDGRYAAHTRGLNTGSIGVAVCAMGGAVERPFSAGKWPITDAQWRALYAVCADLCEHYGLRPVPLQLCTHAEVARVHGVAQRGKWDIRLTRDGRLVDATAAGDEIRREVAALLEHCQC